jgi:bacterioferritin (cytochrome b1)
LEKVLLHDQILKDKVIDMLNADLENEYHHMLFYMHASHMVKGIERAYLVDFFKNHALGEFNHISQFANKIRSYGGTPIAIPKLTNESLALNSGSIGILYQALEMEMNVVRNYTEQRKFFDSISELDASLVLFIEEQIEDSQKDIDELIQMLENGDR